MANVKWHARMIHPLNKPSSPGHYDLMIKGTMTLHGRTYRDPVFSYHNDSNGVGTLYVFNASYSHAAYRSFTPYNLYHYIGADTCNETQFRQLGAYISGMTDTEHITNKALVTTSGAVVGYAAVYPITNNYQIYDVNKRNCFILLGEWTHELGHNHIQNYASTHKPSEYTTRAMVESAEKLAGWSLQANVPIT